MPIVIYGRKHGLRDEFFSVSNNLVIKQSELARDLLVSVKPKFFNNSLTLLDSIFTVEKFVYLIFNIDDEKSICTAIEKIAQTRGAITIHNPGYKNTTNLMKFCLDKNIHLIENIDGSADSLQVLIIQMTKSEKSDLFQVTVREHQNYLYLAIFLSIFVAYLPVAPIVYMRTVFGPVINSQSISFLLSLAILLILALIANGILEWIRERVLLSGTISFINKLEEKVLIVHLSKVATNGVTALKHLRI